LSALSVILITLNEERNIEACLRSVEWADEIIVVDSQSTDRTVEIARSFTDKVFVIDWKGFAASKNFALQQAQSDWVLWIDADERVPAELATEIRQVISQKPQEDGFAIARRAFFLGRWIKHCGWYPGYVLRLFRRGKACFNDNRVHEGLILQGRQGRLQNDLLHYTDDSLEHYLWKFNRYTSLAAQDLVQRGRKAGWLGMIGRSLHTFFRMYLVKRGFMDGVEGLMLCLLSANYVAMKYAKLWEARNVTLVHPEKPDAIENSPTRTAFS